MKIEIKNLNKNFGNHVLFDNLNLEIESNKVTCIYGKSGCGKTTIIDIIGLIEKFNSGTVLYDGIAIKSKNDVRNMLREKIGFIFQDFGLIENETVYQNMKMVYKVRKLKDQRTTIDNLLHDLNLENMLDRKVFELSGGEQQRVAIAKTILKNPDIILADEPTASLDTENKKIVLTMLRDFVDSGKTVIIVSHDSEILEYADIIIDLAEVKKRYEQTV
ncbi:ATP-binding cassette domain-containing protein [Anaerorhabdus sp.]|uniref:ATP-binding cassette domain-containing protein n=1 Tax=Anaerorhabdus sp. TaxID=1872524 RepID=UPI002FC5B2DD